MPPSPCLQYAFGRRAHLSPDTKIPLGARRPIANGQRFASVCRHRKGHFQSNRILFTPVAKMSRWVQYHQDYVAQGSHTGAFM